MTHAVDLSTFASSQKPVPAQVSILGYRLHPRTGAEVVAAMTWAVTNRQRLVLANVNLHAMAVMFESPRMARLLSQEDAIVTIDSMPVLFIGNLFGSGLARSKRTTSLDFYDEMFRIGAARGWSFAYVGARSETLSLGLAELRRRFAGLQIEGRAGFFDMEDASPGSDQLKVVDWLNERSHDVVIVGMGMPRQEEWIERVQHMVSSRVFMPAGAYIDYQVGVQKAAPRWLGQVGLEWAFRLAHSPRRLAYRYMIEPVVLILRLLTREHPQAPYLKPPA